MLSLLPPELPAQVEDPGGRDSLVVMFWNLENFFDWKRDTLLDNGSEAEFSSFGKKHWTKARFRKKCNAVAKTVFWIGEQEGRLPDVIGVAEVENSFVLRRLLDWTSLGRAGYNFVHFDSPDPRGIDVALLYRRNSLKLIEARPVRVDSLKDGSRLLSRDILLGRFLLPDGDSISFLVNHHPSKYGADSDWKRKVAMGRLADVTGRLLREGNDLVVAMGDFNDTPPSTEEYSRIMVNLALPLHRKGVGSIKFDGRWELIDMFFVSPGLVRKEGPLSMKVFLVPFLSVKDNAFSGEKPLRTFSGPRYVSGVSDHCPIVLAIP